MSLFEIGNPLIVRDQRAWIDRPRRFRAKPEVMVLGRDRYTRPAKVPTVLAKCAGHDKAGRKRKILEDVALESDAIQLGISCD
jgi:hypothetical protein